ncbi:Branched-chain-amino-acid aminotransferase [Poriferisphaera corsica]|uniref:branched-chain-amino-acid transaminase n=1 Tax=Poriferisphaera corsica TaxID=2528020 RepID=A0A517YV10_9BACT|nr:aminotransferase class IV [Poriferisphaera corsica]QDU34045.1 Branched-chain-amino-acid aminotransferase [Poriferisphaera corsica]
MSEYQIYHNGSFHDPAAPILSAQDAAFQHAIGLFTTFSVYHSQPFRLEQHINRLEASAIDLGLAPALDKAQLSDAVHQTIAHNNIDRARIRLTFTPGNLSLLRPNTDENSGTSGGAAQPTPTVIIQPTPAVEYDPAYFNKGIRVVVAQPSANPFDPNAGHKTLAYWSNLRSLRQAAAAGAGEALLLNITNHLASGSVSNIFLIKDGTLLTPIAHGEEVEDALPAPVLPGITRAAIIEIAQKLDIPIKKQMLSINDLLEADEAFLTNSSWLILPITSVEQKELSNNKIGPITQHLRLELLKLIESETNPDGNLTD